jgi:hypothetical protein
MRNKIIVFSNVVFLLLSSYSIFIAMEIIFNMRFYELFRYIDAYVIIACILLLPVFSIIEDYKIVNFISAFNKNKIIFVLYYLLNILNIIISIMGYETEYKQNNDDIYAFLMMITYICVLVTFCLKLKSIIKDKISLSNYKIATIIVIIGLITVCFVKLLLVCSVAFGIVKDTWPLWSAFVIDGFFVMGMGTTVCIFYVSMFKRVFFLLLEYKKAK